VPLLFVETGNQSPETIQHLPQGATSRRSVYALLPNHQDGVARTIPVVFLPKQVV
jgi:hypothetical protein